MSLQFRESSQSYVGNMQKKKKKKKAATSVLFVHIISKTSYLENAEKLFAFFQTTDIKFVDIQHFNYNLLMNSISS